MDTSAPADLRLTGAAVSPFTHAEIPDSGDCRRTTDGRQRSAAVNETLHAHERTLLKIGQLIVTIIRNDGSEQVVLQGAVDADVGLDLAFASGALVFDLADPLPDDIVVTVLVNPLGVDEVVVENDILPPLVASLLPSLAGSLASFPLPEFFGLQLSGVEITRNGQFLTLYANLVAGP